jgi:predicted RNA-binding protein YlxR (DUF448 family)
MCVVCRKREYKEILFRYVWCDGRLVWDKVHKINARGVYIHPECRDSLPKMKPRTFEHALRLKPSEISFGELLKIAEEI